MAPLSNEKLISLFNNLTSKVDKLTEIVNFQTSLIQDLKRDNERLGKVVKSELGKNSDSIKVLPAQIHKNIYELESHFDNNNSIIFFKSNTDDIITDIIENIDFTNKNTFTEFINTNLDLKININDIVNINKIKPKLNKDTVDNSKSNSTKKNINNKYIIKLNSIYTKIDILKNKTNILNSDYNIFPYVNSVTNNIFYKA